MEKKQFSVLGRILMLLFLLYAVISIVNLYGQISEKRAQLALVDMRVEEYTQANESVKEQLAGGLSDEAISEIARVELGYAAPGERVFIDTSSK